MDFLIKEFLVLYKEGIENVRKAHKIGKSKKIEKELSDYLSTIDIGDSNQNNEIYDKLFCYTNEYFKNKANLIRVYLYCQGCSSINKISLLESQDILECQTCWNELFRVETTTSKEYLLFSTFCKYNKIGYKCSECGMFIPQPFNNKTTATCPYYNCSFVGPFSSLQKIAHPTIAANPIKLMDSENVIEDKYNESLNKRIDCINRIIAEQIAIIPYNSSNFTVKHKVLVYQAFLDVLKKYPQQMVNYLYEHTRGGGFQHKIFQEYIKLLEQALPFSYKKGNKIYNIDSLLHSELDLFDGISIYDGIINNSLEIKNGTKEIYIGGRKGSYTKPFYIGKLLNVVHSKTGESLLNKVFEYSFLKIKMKDICINTPITVTHLRVPPHYQMGGMVYVNRIRKSIVDQLLLENNVK